MLYYNRVDHLIKEQQNENLTKFCILVYFANNSIYIWKFTFNHTDYNAQ